MRSPTRFAATGRRLLASSRGALALAAFALAATASPAASAAGELSLHCKPAFKPTTVTVMYQPSGLSSYFYASAAGIWQKFGLKLRQVKIEAGQSELAALAGGSVDFAFIGGPPTLTAIGRKLPVTVIFSTNDVSYLEGLVVAPDSGIKTLADLEGKTVASPKGSSAWVGMHLTLAKAGVPVDKVHLLNLSPNAIQASFSNGTVKAAWIWDTWIERLKSLGGKVVTLEHEHGVSEPNTWVVNNTFLKEHPDVVARFVAALSVGADGANKDPSVAAPEFSELTGITHAQALEIMRTEPTFNIATGLSQDSPLSFVNARIGLAETLARSSAVLQKYGILPDAPNREQIAKAIDVSTLHLADDMLAKRCSYEPAH